MVGQNAVVRCSSPTQRYQAFQLPGQRLSGSRPTERFRCPDFLAAIVFGTKGLAPGWLRLRRIKSTGRRSRSARADRNLGLAASSRAAPVSAPHTIEPRCFRECDQSTIFQPTTLKKPTKSPAERHSKVSRRGQRFSDVRHTILFIFRCRPRIGLDCRPTRPFSRLPASPRSRCQKTGVKSRRKSSRRSFRRNRRSQGLAHLHAGSRAVTNGATPRMKAKRSSGSVEVEYGRPRPPPQSIRLAFQLASELRSKLRS